MITCNWCLVTDNKYYESYSLPHEISHLKSLYTSFQQEYLSKKQFTFIVDYAKIIIIRAGCSTKGFLLKKFLNMIVDGLSNQRFSYD